MLTNGGGSAPARIPERSEWITGNAEKSGYSDSGGPKIALSKAGLPVTGLKLEDFGLDNNTLPGSFFRESGLKPKLTAATSSSSRVRS
jgi:hypothetical protein